MVIIFTVTNQVTGQVYVGTTSNDLGAQWNKMLAASKQKLDYLIYYDILQYGEEAFIIEEWDRAESAKERVEIEKEALEHFSAISLKGCKTSTVDILTKKKLKISKQKIKKSKVKTVSDISDDENLSMQVELACKTGIDEELLCSSLEKSVSHRELVVIHQKEERSTLQDQTSVFIEESSVEVIAGDCLESKKESFFIGFEKSKEQRIRDAMIRQRQQKKTEEMLLIEKANLIRLIEELQLKALQSKVS